MAGRLKIEILDNGKLIKTIRKHNLITDRGREHIANQLSSSPDEPVMSYMAIGDGTGQSASDQTLASETARVVLVRREQGSGGDANKVVYEAYFEEGVATGLVSEAGIFNANTGGTMLCYANFGPINKTDSIAIRIVWEVGFMSN